MATYTSVAILSLFTGLSSKFADLLNEHGVGWFKWSSEVMGIVWAVGATLTTLSNRNVAALWLATVLYWFLVLKLDFFNHALAGICVVLAAMHEAQEHDLSLAAVYCLLVWLYISGAANSYLKRKLPDNRALMCFLRLRLRYYIGPVVYSLASNSGLPLTAIIFGMAGTEIVTITHARIASRNEFRRFVFGIQYSPEQVGSSR